MKTIFKTTVFAAAAALALTACEGANENAMEDAGEQNAEVVNEQAEAAEDAGQISDDQADAVTGAAEDQADNMEAQGDAMDEGAAAAGATTTE
jgi:archaellum component FlaG (FlaF/FlaG flagellin family)